ncbi:hypothetical protein JB92DRAFT_3132120 [Gautieria morchelliformis]|nr:hypothetical protein JB92DRAFT_3132120 [Gautieria morchelliformis]
MHVAYEPSFGLGITSPVALPLASAPDTDTDQDPDLNPKGPAPFLVALALFPPRLPNPRPARLPLPLATVRRAGLRKREWLGGFLRGVSVWAAGSCWNATQWAIMSIGMDVVAGSFASRVVLGVALPQTPPLKLPPRQPLSLSAHQHPPSVSAQSTPSAPQSSAPLHPVRRTSSPTQPSAYILAVLFDLRHPAVHSDAAYPSATLQRTAQPRTPPTYRAHCVPEPGARLSVDDAHNTNARLAEVLGKPTRTCGRRHTHRAPPFPPQSSAPPRRPTQPSPRTSTSPSSLLHPAVHDAAPDAAYRALFTLRARRVRDRARYSPVDQAWIRQNADAVWMLPQGTWVSLERRTFALTTQEVGVAGVSEDDAGMEVGPENWVSSVAWDSELIERGEAVTWWVHVPGGAMVPGDTRQLLKQRHFNSRAVPEAQSRSLDTLSKAPTSISKLATSLIATDRHGQTASFPNGFYPMAF